MDNTRDAPDEQIPALVDLGQDVHLIDTAMSGYPGITAAYLLATDRPCLIETGTARSFSAVRAGLAALGIGPADLATIVVTHVHLDHAGGVGDFAAHFPRAEVVVHERGARHLVEPARLVASARRVYGELMDEVFGPLQPTAPHRIRALGEIGNVDLGGGRSLSTYYSPGHAQHHIGLLDSSSGDLYVGDAAGVYVPEADLVRPATPPPDFDLDTALTSLELFGSLQPRRLLFSHYGPVTDVARILDRSKQELRLWVELAREARHARLTLDHTVAMVTARTAQRYAALLVDQRLEQRFEQLNSTESNLLGIMRWLDRVQEGQ